jgi:hypothetical protein
LREFIERQAAREDRTVAGQIRHWVSEQARRAERPLESSGLVEQSHAA